MNILIKNGIIIPVDTEEAVFFNGDIAITDDLIRYVGNVPVDFRADKIINAQNSIIMPGMVNSHCHLSMVLLRNFADDLDLFTWLHTIWPVEDLMTAQDIYQGSLLGAVELLRSGVTTFADMYFMQQETCRAVEEAGIRGVIAATFMGDMKATEERLPAVEKLFSNWHKAADGRILINIAPHAAYTCTKETLITAVSLAKHYETTLHTHISESKKETQESWETHGVSPVTYLADLGIFSVPAFAAHCVQLDSRDISTLQAYGVTPVNNPTSNLKLGNGFAPVKELTEQGVTVALGTDGASSNNNLDMFEELHLAAILNKGVTGDPTAISAYQAIKMATINGAKALGLEAVTGSLKPGKKADVVIIDTAKAHLTPLNNPISAVAYGVQSADVKTVICNGKILLEDYNVVSLDEQQILSDAQNAARALTARSQA